MLDRLALAGQAEAVHPLGEASSLPTRPIARSTPCRLSARPPRESVRRSTCPRSSPRSD